MAEVTSDEIRKACEAVGWEWAELADWAIEDGSVVRFSPMTSPDADALALLGATGEDFEIKSGAFEGYRVYECRVAGVYTPVQDTFREAAVRAVLAWAEKKGEGA